MNQEEHQNPASVFTNQETNFSKELEMLINRFSIENESNTPDYILSDYLLKCLKAFNEAMLLRNDHYNPPPPYQGSEV
jgi:hypothetical protein